LEREKKEREEKGKGGAELEEKCRGKEGYGKGRRDKQTEKRKLSHNFCIPSTASDNE